MRVVSCAEELCKKLANDNELDCAVALVLASMGEQATLLNQHVYDSDDDGVSHQHRTA